MLNVGAHSDGMERDDTGARLPTSRSGRARALVLTAMLAATYPLISLYTGNLELGRAPETGSGIRAAHSIVHQGNFEISEYFRKVDDKGYAYIQRDGRLYSMEPPASSLTFALFLAPYRTILPAHMNFRFGKVNDLTGARVAAVTMLVLGAWLLQLTSIPKALIVTATIALATSQWTVAGGGAWTHTSAVLWLTIGLCLWTLSRSRPGLFPVAGAALAVATLCRPTMLPASLLIALDPWLTRRDKRMALTTFALVAAVGVLGLYMNWEIYGSVLGGRSQIVADVSTTHGVSSYVSLSPMNLIGQLVSPSRGLFVYSPVLLFALPGLWRSLLASAPVPLRLMSMAGLATFLLYAFLATWWGGRVYGPRYLTDLMPFMALWLATTPLPSKRRSIWAGGFALALAWSIWVQFLGASTYPCGWNSEPTHIDVAHERLWDIRDTQIARCMSVRNERRAAAAGQPAPTELPPARPPVVLITLDTTRVDHLAIYGYEKETAPNLTRFAKDGLVFNNFVTMSSWTLPTHASLFTGLFPSTHQAHYTLEGNVALSDVLGEEGLLPQFRANRLPEEAVTLAEVLREAGYGTYGVAAGPWLKPIFGLAQGFDQFDADSNSSGGRRADEVNRLALQYLEDAGQDPFLLFINYFDPHDPYDAPDDQSARFLDPQPARNPSSKWPGIRAAYDSEIAYMDRHLGEILDSLRTRGRYDESWIIITSDHGEHFGEHGLEYHGFSLYEAVTRGILVIKPPRGVILNLDRDQRCQSLDIMPTLVSALGIKSPPRMEGQRLGAITHPSVTELFRNPGNVHWKGKRFDRELRAIYQADFKLVTSSKTHDRDAGLFDLSVDPSEFDNLLEERPRKAKRLEHALANWRKNLLPPLTPERVENIDPETQRQLEALGYLPTQEE